MTDKRMRLGEHEVVRIGLGTNRLTSTPEHVAFVREAMASGIDHIDTAHIYAGGESEATIGDALDGANGALVATKGGFAPADAKPSVLAAQIDESLRRLRTDAIELYYLHRVSDEVPLEDSVGALKEARDAGKVRHVGLSDVTVDQIERARRVVPIVAVQNHYNLTERKHEAVIDHCAENGIVFVPYFPLRAGFPAAVGALAARHEATPSQVALAWLLQRSPAMLPIPGTLSVDHARENLAALDLVLTEDEFASLR